MNNSSNRPVILIIMDGVGLSKTSRSNAVRDAHLETLDDLWHHYPSLLLQASGHYVGIPDGEAGNSEVGHNALGTGQIVPQGPLRTKQAFNDGIIFASDAWRGAIQSTLDHHSTLHFVGIFSDGDVHSDIHQLFAMLAQAQKEGITRIRIHPAFDGRDVSPQSADTYIRQFNDFITSLGSPDYQIADGGGRMLTWADRYESDWGVVEAGWDIAVRGQGRQFPDPLTAITTLRAEDPSIGDQYLPPFVIADADHQPIGTIKKGDALICFNFRADRAIMLSRAFTYYDFPHFDRGSYSPDDIYFAGLTEYDSDLHVPALILVSPITIDHTLSDLLDSHGIHQYAISETVKYGHITYYFDGNHDTEDSPLHTDVQIPSDPDSETFVSRPWMKSADIADQLIAAIESGKYQFLRVNFPNGDMVGHFAELEPTIVAMESVDIALGRILKAADKVSAVVIITADHGNAEELEDEQGKPKTSHTTNPVPCIFYDRSKSAALYHTTPQTPDLSIASLASTIALLLGLDPLEGWQPPLIQLSVPS